MGNKVLSLTARDFYLDTGAADDQELVSFASLGAKIKIGSLSLSGEARNFAFMGDGSFKAKPGFGVFIGVGSDGQQFHVAGMAADQDQRNRDRVG